MTMETMNEKVKRNYNKVDLNSVNALTKIAAEKKLSFAAIGNQMDVSHITAKKFLMQPELMNGIQRKKIAEIFELNIVYLSALIDDMIK